MNLRIIKGGLLDTVQDLGRYGWQHLGVNPGGAMDKTAAQLANILIGNDPTEAVIELHFPASEFFFEQPALIALTGADFSAHVNGDEISTMHPILLNKYSILQFHAIKKGARAYLAIHNGLDIQQWLNSSSTHLKAGVGGFNGRLLQKDDEIPMRVKIDFCPHIGKKEFHILPWKAEMVPSESSSHEIWILPANESGRLTDTAKEQLTDQSFVITSQSDRMGYRLKSEALQVTHTEEIISTAVNFGTVQLLPDGQLIILMADHQTSGGYPRVAHVISAHHSKLAQMKPGEAIRFRFTDLRKAEELMLKQQQHLLQLQHACKLKLDNFLHVKY